MSGYAKRDINHPRREIDDPAQGAPRRHVARESFVARSVEFGSGLRPRGFEHGARPEDHPLGGRAWRFDVDDGLAVVRVAVGPASPVLLCLDPLHGVGRAGIGRVAALERYPVACWIDSDSRATTIVWTAVAPVPYLRRLVDPLLDELLAHVAAVLIVGPRATGKTTTAERRARTVIRLGEPAQAAALASNVDAVLATAELPVLIDEWQLVPDIMGAVKRAVDRGAAPGSYLLTGSSRADLQAEGWPATGRVVRVPLYGLTERERRQHLDVPSLVDHLFEGSPGPLGPLDPPPDIRHYLSCALASGFPEAFRIASPRAHRLWLASYVDQLVLRDAVTAGQDRDPQRLRRYLRVLAANLAGVVNHRSLYEAASLNRLTATAYDGLLELLYVTERVPAWTQSRFCRLNQTPKRYLTDPALTAPLLNIDVRAVLRDGDLLGRIVDNFVFSQLRAECIVADSAPVIHHLRRSDARHEVDLLLEGPAGALVAIEIRAAATVTPADARHLIWLRDQTGDQMTAGVVFHTGPVAFQLDERIWALPIAAIWT
jgi:uncharacterized protein